MSIPQYGAVPRDFQVVPPTSFIAANSTLAKVVVDCLPSGGGGNQGLPTDTQLVGGGRILDCVVTSTDGSNKDLITYLGYQTTLYANMGVAAVTNTTNATVTRTVGSFITDGWVAGDLCMLFGATSAGNNGVLLTVTTVASTTLTFNGTISGGSAETEGAGFRIVKVSPQERITIPANSGVGATTTLNVSLIGATYDASVDRTGVWLGSNAMFIASCQAAVSALPAYISIGTRIARY